MSNQEPATILLIDDHPMLRNWRKTAYQYGTRYHRGWRSE
ncbi:transcriptional regulator NarL [Escherichia coli]|nr:transcriptional regulator NarL [Escherichia coli]